MSGFFSELEENGLVVPDFKKGVISVAREVFENKNRRTGDKDKKILMLVDGLGYGLVKRVLTESKEHSQLLNGATVEKITTTFPSTTTAVTSSVTSGMTTAEHGVVGWSNYIKEAGLIVEPFSDAAQISKSFRISSIGLEDIIPKPDLLINAAKKEKLLALGDEYVSHVYEKIVPNCEEKLHATATDMFINLRNAVKSNDYGTIYAYHGMIDHTEHAYGPKSEKAAHTVLNFFLEMRRLLLPQLQESDYNLVMIADHGQVEIERSLELDKGSKLMEYLSLPPWGDSRVLFMNVSPGKEAAFNKFFDGAYGKDAILVESDVAIKSGIFGKTAVIKGLRDRFGSHICILKGDNTTMKYQYPLPNSKKFDKRGAHSSITPEEMYIPLIVY